MLLRLDAIQLDGVNITSQTTRALRLRPQRFSALQTISHDGLHFPTDPPAFRAAVLAQAQDLYGGRPGLRMCLPRLIPGIRAPTATLPPDDPPFTVQMLMHLDPTRSRTPLDAPVTPAEFRCLLQRGSAATALDELPRPLLQHLPAHGVSATLHLLQHATSHPHSQLLLTALHLPLKKKEPAWLLRNSRPVLLQPYLRRLEANAIFQRMMHGLESSGAVPSEMFAYRAQLSAQSAGILLTPPEKKNTTNHCVPRCVAGQRKKNPQ